MALIVLIPSRLTMKNNGARKGRMQARTDSGKKGARAAADGARKRGGRGNTQSARKRPRAAADGARKIPKAATAVPDERDWVSPRIVSKGNGKPRVIEDIDAKKDSDFLDSMTPEMAEQYRGEWIALAHGAIVAHGKDPEQVF